MLIQSFLFISLVVFPQLVFAQDPLQALVSKAQRSGVKIGVAVHEAGTGKEVFTHNANEPLNPASTMKVLTSVVALKHLGGSYTYKTPITTDSLSKHVAENLYIKGVGDPSIVEERLWRVAKDLRVRGVEKINGDIVIDNSFFKGFEFSGQENGSSRAYNALISPLAVNFNSFAVVAVNNDGALAVTVDPPIDYFQLESRVKASGNALGIERRLKEGHEHIVVGGGVSHEKVKYASVQDPVAYAGHMLAWLFTQVGIEFSGKVREGQATGKKRLLLDESKPLSYILTDLNKFSNNFTAEMILKTLAAIKGEISGTTAAGTGLLTAYLQDLGVDAAEYAIFNGSGLSRDNRISAMALNKVLLSAYDDVVIRSDFMASLAVAGVDGTLETRFKDTELRGNVKAKTGTLYDVSALSGYLETRDKKILAFTILINGAGVANGFSYGLQKELLTALFTGVGAP